MDISRRALLISKGWVQAVLLVVLFGFFVLGLLAYRTYQAKPPTPERVVDPQGELLYTGEDVRSGQQVFLHNGLMEYGSVFGHGAYLGPDFTADYLRRSSDFVRSSYGGAGSDTAARRTIEDFRTNRYDEASGTLTLTAPQAEAHRRLVGHYSRFFSEPTTEARAAPEGDHRRDRAAAADRVLRLDRMGRLDQPPGPQLLVHQQLAARAARRQPADGQRDRVERAVADRAARRRSGCCSPRSGAGASSAGTAASRRRCRSARPATWR